MVLQPCSVKRVPDGPARWIGPVNDGDAMRAICEWLERGDWELCTLPGRLHAGLNRATTISRQN